MNSLAPQDATRYWLSAHGCNDLFLLYCFADTGRSAEWLRAEIAARAAGIGDLRVRLRERRFAYPAWEPCEIDDDQIVEYNLEAPPWSAVVAALGGLLGEGLRADSRAWRVHLFRGVTGAPTIGGTCGAATTASASTTSRTSPAGAEGPALVAVLQLSHALADGQRAAAIARALWTTSAVSLEGPAVESGWWGNCAAEASALAELPLRVVRTIVRGFAAARAQRELAGLTARGELPAPAPVFPPTLLNRPPAPVAHAVRMIVREDLRVPGRTVTVVVLTAISVALSRYLRNHGEAVGTLGAQVSVALPAGEASVDSVPVDSAAVDRMSVGGEDIDRSPVDGGVVDRSVVDEGAVGRSFEDGGTVDRMSVGGRPARPRSVYKRLVDNFHMWSRKPVVRNNYLDVSVDLPVDEPELARRADLIAATLVERRTRARHPLLRAAGRVTEVLPAPVLRRDIAGYPLDLVPEAISGHTVVSSVNRGPADLSLGGGAVRFTAGFPALGAVMHLTHGVHGLGTTVTVSVHADPAVMPDIDTYADLVETALTETVSALRS
ncbi:hypothetical protein ABIA39_002236 [Nocardia sp. GAS34]|uniref:WS/DGAT domain-containing protein n=1 Tax=unclassified Nocardia TaxID=2637762 RepID=UPI003D23B3A0